MKKFLAALLFLVTPASAQIVNSLPFNLQNGTTADATQVMSNFNQIVNNTNTNAAKNGANSDITSLLGLSTPIDYLAGGSSVYIGGTSTGTGDAQVVASPVPLGFSLAAGKRLIFVAGNSNTTTVTLNANGTGALAVKKNTPAGLAVLVANDIVVGAYAEVVYDGTQYELLNPSLVALTPATLTASTSAALANTTLTGSLSYTSPIVTPAGRLTLTTGTPVINTDVTAATSVFYTPYAGNLVPVYNGTAFLNLTFSELTLTLASQHLANTLYDVFVINNSGSATLVTGPAWTTAGNYVSAGTLTTGSASRGTGAGTTQLARVNGIWTNAVAMSTARNGASTFAVSANQGTYVGTIWIDATVGQETCQVTWGQNRKCGVWNAYNRVPMTLLAGDSTASWNYITATIRAANNTAANSVTILQGLPEETVTSIYSEYTAISATSTPNSGIGAGSTTVFCGVTATGSVNTSGTQMVSSCVLPPFLGLQSFTALEKGTSAGSESWSGTNANMQLSAAWRG